MALVAQSFHAILTIQIDKLPAVVIIVNAFDYCFDYSYKDLNQLNMKTSTQQLTSDQILQQQDRYPSVILEILSIKLNGLLGLAFLNDY